MYGNGDCIMDYAISRPIHRPIPMTSNVIKSGISEILKASIPEVTTRYTERIEENFKRPCFHIWQIDQSQTRILGNYYMRTHQMDVRCFLPEEGQYYYQLEEIADKLYDELEMLTVRNVDDQEARMWGREMRHNIEDSVLHFYVLYQYRCYRPSPYGPFMRILDIDEHIKIEEGS